MFVATTTNPDLEKFMPYLNRYINRPEFVAEVQPALRMAMREFTEAYMTYGDDGLKSVEDVVARVNAKLDLLEGSR